MWGLGDSGRPPPFRFPGEPRSGLDESDRDPGLPILLVPVLLLRWVRSVSAKAFLLFSIRSGCYTRAACCQQEHATHASQSVQQDCCAWLVSGSGRPQDLDSPDE